MTTARVLLLASLFAVALPAGAQYQPPPPPPSGLPPPPSYGPPSGPPAYPPYAPRQQRLPPRYVLPEPAPANTVRVQIGFAFASDAYDCWYVGGYYGYYSCGYGYGGVAWPNLNAEMDVGLSPSIALTIGGNVFGGDWNGISNTIWEPHVDMMFRSSPYNDTRGRLRLGLGLYVADANEGIYAPGRTQTGGAFRIGAGASFFARSSVGLGIDAIFEAGSLGGYYVSTMQLMIGPEFHF